MAFHLSRVCSTTLKFTMEEVVDPSEVFAACWQRFGRRALSARNQGKKRDSQRPQKPAKRKETSRKETPSPPSPTPPHPTPPHPKPPHLPPSPPPTHHHHHHQDVYTQACLFFAVSFVLTLEVGLWLISLGPLLRSGGGSDGCAPC